ncbi:DUF4293 domain-containing protein [Parabacteroides sp. PF5-9]|uniref:DUF4293 domain-containing protein n=1 Tax=Parabacteroides sp. PF5-9 TaxID=1742404 RepID=UPI002473138A|nr:DUF4293 domain-containing protein [Parabacteroides sp. PF5-9]MDH6357696.1 putative membrane protein [Parabacteroides sp. PF5-9]
MLQRIQTIYLLIIVALTTITLFLPLAVISEGDQFYTFDATGLSTSVGEKELLFPTWGLFGLTAIIALIALATIFLYKKRVLQIRLCVFNAILMLGYYGLFAFFAWRITGQMEEPSFMVRITLSFPLISLILNYLAIRNIGADETLVRSLDRLR